MEKYFCDCCNRILNDSEVCGIRNDVLNESYICCKYCGSECSHYDEDEFDDDEFDEDFDEGDFDEDGFDEGEELDEVRLDDKDQIRKA